MKENITRKIKENNVDDTEAISVVEKNLPKSEGYQSRLLKLIPTEDVGVYIFINGIIPDDSLVNKFIILRWVVFGLLFIINPFYLSYASAVTNKKQIVICTIGFAVLVFSLGNLFMIIGNHAAFSMVLGSIILALYTFVVPIFLYEYATQG